MSDEYLIYGSELSPYSVKVRSYFRYKGIPHRWIVRSMKEMGEFNKYAKLPLVPLVVTPGDQGIQDSTPIMEKMEALFPEPAIHPSEPALKFISELLEEFADEWVNKPMFHYRWTREIDQDSGALRIALDQTGGDEKAANLMAAMIKQRMVPRLSFVGSSPQTQEQIENAYVRLLELLEAHLESRPYVLGARPSFADLGLWGQLYELWSDPTPGALMKERAPRVAA
ncbi:MAG: glutathione S-transferase, partial [Chrysiogenetes bacterium]|nr:glutathione S-transferase [Chrysiogenetes bacterium]